MVEFPQMFVIEFKLNIVPVGLAFPYMLYQRVLNSMALIKGSSLFEILIKQTYISLPELTKIFSLNNGYLIYDGYIFKIQYTEWFNKESKANW